MADLVLPKTSEFNAGNLARGTDVLANDQAIETFLEGANLDRNNVNTSSIVVANGTVDQNIDGEKTFTSANGIKIPNTAPTEDRGIGRSNSILQQYQNSTATYYEPCDIRQYYFEKDDFFVAALDPSTFAGPFGFIEENANSGSAGGTLNSADSTHPGVVQVDTGAASAAGAAGFRSSGTAILFGGGQWSMEWMVRIPTLSDGTHRFTCRVGFLDAGIAEPADGVYFRYVDNVNSGRWVLVARNNSTETTTNSSSAPVANTWYRLKIVVNAAGTLATYYVNGTSIGTTATNIPTASGRQTGLGMSIIKSVGTASRTFEADYVQLEFIPTAVR